MLKFYIMQTDYQMAWVSASEYVRGNENYLDQLPRNGQGYMGFSHGLKALMHDEGKGLDTLTKIVSVLDLDKGAADLLHRFYLNP